MQDFAQSALLDRIESPLGDFETYSPLWSLTVELITGGRRINAFRPYYLPRPGDLNAVPLAWQIEQRRIFSGQSTTFRGEYVSGVPAEVLPFTWNNADEFDDYGNMTTGGGAPIQWIPPDFGNSYYTTFNPPWHGATNPQWASSVAQTANRHTFLDFGTGKELHYALDSILEGELVFSNLLSPLVSYANGLDFDTVILEAWGLAAFRRDEYRGVSYNAEPAIGYTGSFEFANEGNLPEFPYLGPYIAGVLPDLYTQLPGGGSSVLLSGWSYTQHPLYGWSLGNYNELQTPQREYSDANVYTCDPLDIAVQRARFWLNSPADPDLELSYWIGAAIIYYDYEPDGLTSPVTTVWPVVRWIRDGTVTTTNKITLNIPTGNGFTDFVPLAGKYLTHSVVEFAIVNETPAEWTARTGIKVVKPITSGSDETDYDGGYTGDHAPWDEEGDTI